MAKSNIIKLHNVRGSFVFLTEPREDRDDPDKKPSYQMQIIISKKDKQLKKFRKLVERVAREKFPKIKKLGKLKMIPRDGDVEGDGKHHDGHVFFNARNYKPVGIVNGRGQPPTQKELHDYCYSGAYFHVSIDVFAYDHPKGGKGVSAGLRNVMLYKKGDRLDNYIPAEDEFEDDAQSDWGDDDDDDGGW